MLKHLQAKWKVNGRQLFLILCVFALTGSLTAYLSRSLPGWLGVEPEDPFLLRLLLRLGVLIFGYQVIILLVSLPFGQFAFFWNYEKKILAYFSRISGFSARKKAQEADIPNS